MNRRAFISQIATVAAGFMILPGATTYARQWKRTADCIIIPMNSGVLIPMERQLGSISRQLFAEQRPLAWWWAASNFTAADFERLVKQYGEPT